jgi:RNA polymerase sigma factor for flagellar operon FliA
MPMTAQPPALDAEELEFVRRVARGIHALLPRTVEVDDLVSYGAAGMIEARKRFDASRGVPFRSFAHYRVRGAIFDGLRQMSWLPPNAYKRATARERADGYMETLAEAAWGRPSATAAAGLIGQMAADVSVVYLTTEAAAAAAEPRPAAVELPGEDVCDLGRVLDEIEKLGPKERELMRLLYVEDASLSDVGAALGLSRSWACRLHAAALRKLRERLGVADPPGAEATAGGPSAPAVRQGG